MTNVLMSCCFIPMGGGIYIDNSGDCNIFGNTVERKIVGINIHN